MPNDDRRQTILTILQELNDLDGLKRLFWEELNYERENRALSSRQWPESARQPLAEEPILFATGGEDGAFHVVYCRLNSGKLSRGDERLIVNRLTREHPYALFVFSNRERNDWHFLNVKYDENAEKRRLLQRISVRTGEGLRTAAERLQMLDLEAISPDLFTLTPLTIQQRHDDAFDVEKVTKDFYREIANWYFWALKHATFPTDAPKEQDGRDHISVIRLITRLIFCWFIREKGLIPDVLFDESKLAEMLDGFAPGKVAQASSLRNQASVYYRAILQNLFFATLNTEMDQRGWRRADQNFMAHSLYRHKECFRDSRAGLEWFKDIPFLNGGLFECLDRDFGEGVKPRYLRVDGFSDRDDSRPTVPDFLFFGSEQEIDLSDDYGDKKFKKVRVRGLIDTLNRYKFTIEENTPLDQEVALDPELCGKVFENLLAAYNPETGTTARKATGSFYTPREIVDYMVDESLIAYLKGKLEPRMDANGHESGGPTSVSAARKTDATERVPPETDERLRQLLAYDAEMPDFSEAETEALIEAIDGLKALDPAVGSGAFPMGMLHKLVHVLGRLDPGNERWKAKQIGKLDDAVMREDAERVFRENYDDYGRKLYLIENCIYGVDIQPIAVQIAKMRFFISLIVDQKVNPNVPNRGVRALPNLETKFVAANTLIGIERPDIQGKLFVNPTVEALKAELTSIRHQMFTARTTRTKNDLRKKDAAVRLALAEEVGKAFQKAAEEEVLKTQDALAKAKTELGKLQSKPVEWQITRMTNLFGDEEETRVDLTKEKKRRLRDSVKQLEAQLRQKTQIDADLDTTAKQLAAWDPYDQNAHADFFDPEWMFGVTEGFDVVIGNPPYVLLQAGKRDPLLNAYFREHFKVASYKLDLFHLFIERGVSILNDGGVITYIVPSNFASNNYAVTLRKYLLTETCLDRLVFFTEGVFDASVHNLVFVARRPPSGENPTIFSKAAIVAGHLEVTDLSQRKQEHLVDDMCLLVPRLDESYDGVVLKMSEGSRDLGSLASVNFGMQLRDRKKFPKDVLHSPSQSTLMHDHRRCYAGKDIHRYQVDYSGHYCYFNRTAKRGGCWDERVHSAKGKILVRQIGDYPDGGMDFRGYAVLNAAFMILPSSDTVDARFLLGLLNSSAVRFYWLSKFRDDRRTFPKIKGEYLKLIPVPPANKSAEKGLAGLVTRILAAKKTDPSADTTALEREIDEQVYKLYGLTEEEIAIVEGATRGKTGKGGEG